MSYSFIENNNSTSNIITNEDNTNNNIYSKNNNHILVNKQQESSFRDLFNKFSQGKDKIEFNKLNDFFKSLGYGLENSDIEGILKSNKFELNGEFTVDTLLDAFYNWKRKSNSTNNSTAINNLDLIKSDIHDNSDIHINTRRNSNSSNSKSISDNSLKYPTTTSLLNSRFNNVPTLGQLAENVQIKAKAELREVGDSDIGSDDDVGVISSGQEHTGRWTRQEHALFLEALKKYGKEWKKVASMVKTRTVVQTRTHAQKYFQKQAKTLNGLTNTNNNMFNIDEDVDSVTSPLNNKTIVHSSNNSSNSGSKKVKKDLNSSNININTSSHENYNLPIGLKYNFSDENFDYDKQPQANFSLLLSTPITSIMFSPNMTYPQPSPAACGKRKHVELAVAKALAATATVRNDNIV